MRINLSNHTFFVVVLLFFLNIHCFSNFVKKNVGINLSIGLYIYLTTIACFKYYHCLYNKYMDKIIFVCPNLETSYHILNILK